MAITFVIPVRHHQSVKGWGRVQDELALTVASVQRQTTDGWRCVVVANEGTPLPPLPDDVMTVRVALPYVPLPEWGDGANSGNYYEAIRADKGARVLAGIVASRADGHVMVVDYDDFISCHWAELSASAPDFPGWVVDSGIVYDGGWLSYAQTSGFNELCGTSLAVHVRLLGLDAGMRTDPEHIRRVLGSHRFLAGDLEQIGTPLKRCPFPGAAYRVAGPENVSGSPSIRKMFFRRKLLLSEPTTFLCHMSRLRITRTLAPEFGLPAMR